MLADVLAFPIHFPQSNMFVFIQTKTKHATEILKTTEGWSPNYSLFSHNTVSLIKTYETVPLMHILTA